VAKPGLNDPTIATLLRVPNTPEGNAFLKQLRAYAVKGTRILARGRGSRVKAAAAANVHRRRFSDRLPAQYAEYFAVYIDKPALRRLADLRTRQDLQLMQNRIDQLRVELIGRLPVIAGPGMPPEPGARARVNELQAELAQLKSRRAIRL
jgi:hypothetical protein